ncbi:MAG: DUF922 domain-containing Zn-dependent protease [Polyangiaceae bacterium]
MTADGSRNTTCLVLGIVGGIGCGGAVLLSAGVLGALVYFRSAPPPRPVPVRASPPPTTAESSKDEPVESADVVPDASPLPSEIESDTRHEDYAIQGSSASALRSDMDRHGPTDAEGRHDAYTRWNVRWSFPYDRKPNVCGTGDVKVSVTITFVMPDWTPPADAPDDLVRRWNAYKKALELHENGHKEHGLAAAKDILSTLRALPAEPDCDGMNRVANAAARRVIDKYKEKDKTYDRDTRHGATQGARFP